MDIATIILIPFVIDDSKSVEYHVRYSTKAEGPQRGGSAKVLDVLYRKADESEEDFKARAMQYIKECTDDT
jgi:hypothetical protein